MKICLIVASQGKNLELAQKIQKILEEKNVSHEWVDIVAMNLPLYSTASEPHYSAAELIAPYKSQLEADGFIFIAPEYNGGPPPVFSNFLAWVSRSTKNWRDTFNNRPALIATHSAGHGLSVLTIMRLQLSFIGVNVMGRQLATSPQKSIDEAAVGVICDQLIKMCK